MTSLSDSQKRKMPLLFSQSESDKEFGEEAPLTSLRSVEVICGGVGSALAKGWTFRNQGVERSLLRLEDKNPKSANLGLTWEPPCHPAASSTPVFLSVDSEGAPQYEVEVHGGTSEWRRLFALHEFGIRRPEDHIRRRVQFYQDACERVWGCPDPEDEMSGDSAREEVDGRNGKGQTATSKQVRSQHDSPNSAPKRGNKSIKNKQSRNRHHVHLPWSMYRVQ